MGVRQHPKTPGRGTQSPPTAHRDPVKDVGQDQSLLEESVALFPAVLPLLSLLTRIPSPSLETLALRWLV